MANIKQVAERAGLSVSCVSKYLKNPDSVLPTSKARIQAAIQELNYTPSIIARSLRMKKTLAIMIMIHSITNPFFSNLFERLRNKIEARGYTVILQIIGNKPIEPRMLEQVDGALLILPRSERVACGVYSCIPEGFPLVLCHSRKLIDEVPTVILDLKGGIYTLTQHFVDIGCETFAYIGRHENEIASRLKKPGFVECLQHNGLQLNPAAIFFGSAKDHPYDQQDFDVGFRMSRSVTQLPTLPDAVICENDMIALGCILGLISLGIDPTRDIHVGGSDNIPLGGMFVPALTTLDSTDACAACACDELFNLLGGKPAADHTILPKLVVRDT